MLDLIIENGTCVTATGTFKADVAVDDGTIVALGDTEQCTESETTVDASDRLVMPGFVDPHVHIDDSSSIDSYETASRAAALGGITTMIDFAWQTEGNDPTNESRSLLAGIERKQEKAAESRSYIDYSLHAGLTVEDAIDDLGTAVDRGVTSFKMFTTYDFGVSNGFIRRALEQLADLDAVGVFHTEDDAVCTELTSKYRSRGRSDPTWYPKSRPDYAEAMAAEDVLRLAKATGAKYYGVHTSCRKAARVIEQFRDDGSQIRTETCTHYTQLDDTIHGEQGNLPLIAPPLRTPDDIEAMFEHLQEGTIDIVSTDHSPHYEAEKSGPWWNSPYGAGSLQVSVPVFHEVAVNERDLSPEFLVSAMSTAPARTFGLEGKGTLAPGTDADIVLFDPSETFTIRADDTASKQDFTLYEGLEVTGAVDHTFVRGAAVVSDGEMVADNDHGSFVPRTTPDWSV